MSGAKGHRVAFFHLSDRAASRSPGLPRQVPTECSVTFLTDAEQGLPAAALAPGTIVIDGCSDRPAGEPAGIYARLIARQRLWAAGHRLGHPSGLNGDTGNGDLAITLV